ncbi:MAG: hypothetical protein L3J43_08535 [Sulfurovum sp.]|nr:hypothetical protein [Sulfurovum sp.]
MDEIEEKKLLIELINERHKICVLPLTKAAKEWGSSYSDASKLFSPKNGKSIDIIKKHKMVPVWFMVGNKKMWKITDIVDWLINTTKRNLND